MKKTVINEGTASKEGRAINEKKWLTRLTVMNEVPGIKEKQWLTREKWLTREHERTAIKETMINEGDND